MNAQEQILIENTSDQDLAGHLRPLPFAGLSIVVPVYNSASTLSTLVSRLTDVLEPLGLPYEIILVNDGSRDESWNSILAVSATNACVCGINLMRNYGQHNALLCGIRSAKYDVTVTMDDDLQHPPEEIPKLLALIAAGFDVVYGTPVALPHSFWRNLLSKSTKRVLARATNLSNVRDINAFRAIRTDVRNAFANFMSPNVLFDVLLSWGTARFTSVNVRHEPRRIGRSNYTPMRLINQLMLLLTGYTTAPLRLASLVGFGFTFFGIAIFLYVIIVFFFFGSLPGFVFITSLIALFSGAQLFALGIIGEYLGRIFYRSMDRPTYVIREETQHPADKPCDRDMR